MDGRPVPVARPGSMSLRRRQGQTETVGSPSVLVQTLPAVSPDAASRLRPASTCPCKASRCVSKEIQKV